MSGRVTFNTDRNKAKAIIYNTTGNVLLWGPPGTGKTSLVEWLSHENKQANLWITNGTPDGSSGLVVGHPKIVDDGTGNYWEKGPALQAWERGELFLFDDIHKVSSDAEAELLTIGNDVRIAHKVLPNGDVIRPMPTFRMFATMNGTPDQLDDALRDRFETTILVRTPSNEMLDLLDSDVRAICESAYENCDAIAGELPKFSYRECRSFCRRRKELLNGGVVADQRESDLLAAELSLDGDPVRADGFIRLVDIANASAPEEDD